MSFHAWVALTGVLLLMLALSSAYLKQLPVTASVVYLLVGFAIGPIGFGVIRIEIREAAPWLERLTQIAVIVSLFFSGLRLRVPWNGPAWRAAYILAGPGMLVTIAGIAVFARFALGLDLATALLLGAVIAPTDPVLAGMVAVNNAADRDRMRYGLSGEAGLNDGLAFPFVLLALQWNSHGGAGVWIGEWALRHLAWSVPVALGIGFLMGHGVGLITIRFRNQQRTTSAASDFLALALIALAFALAEAVGATGFLAAFAAGVGLRHAEVKVVMATPHPAARNAPTEEFDQAEIAGSHPPAETLVGAVTTTRELRLPAAAAGVVIAELVTFGDTAERLLEFFLIVLVGITVSVHWDPRAIPLAAVLFLVIRPLGTWFLCARAPVSTTQRWLMGWFGVRGIASVYFVTYILGQGARGRFAIDTTDLTISVIALSILVHGLTALPVISWYERRLARHKVADEGGVVTAVRA
ncbi:MAG: cation:proton antiporter [Gemmatimonadota bacterium]